jgi:hypothetical protein
MRIKRRIIRAAAVGSAWLATVLLARPGVVVTHSGARYEGDVVERGDDVIVTIRGVQTTVPRGDVASLDYQADFDEEFAARLAKLEANDFAGRLELARWAMERERYIAARDAIEAALAIDPNSSEAVQLQTVVRSKMRLDAQAKTRPDPARRPQRENGVRATDPVDAVPTLRDVLSAEDIQSIRRIEWRADDDAVRVRVEGDAARSYAGRINERYEDFARQSQLEQARRILNDPDSTAEQRAGVMILSDPPALAEFRRVVQPVVLTGCASSGCHGSATATFRLVAPATTDEATYTNFYVLNSYTKRLDRQVPAGGIFGGATEIRMIDRGNSPKSLLAQYSLPPEVAEFDHPKVQNYQPLFQSLSDGRARGMMGWIDRSLRLSPGDYGIEWQPSGASAPTTAPAGGR